MPFFPRPQEAGHHYHCHDRDLLGHPDPLSDFAIRSAPERHPRRGGRTRGKQATARPIKVLRRRRLRRVEEGQRGAQRGPTY